MSDADGNDIVKPILRTLSRRAAQYGNNKRWDQRLRPSPSARQHRVGRDATPRYIVPMRASSAVLRTSRMSNAVLVSWRTACQSLPPPARCPRVDQLEHASPHQTDPTIDSRRLANDLQLADVETHHE
jgi:hypothetical protein